MRVTKAVILWAVVWLPIPAMGHAAQSSYPSVDEFLISLAAVAAPELGEGVVPPMIPLTCTSTAYCSFSTVTCSASSGSCGVGVRQSCPYTQGYAECNGVKKYCPVCPLPPGTSCLTQADCEAFCGGPGSGTCYQKVCRCNV